MSTKAPIPRHMQPWDYSRHTDGVRATPEWQAAHRKYLALADELDGEHDGDGAYHQICAVAYELYVIEAEYRGETPKPMHVLMAMARSAPTTP